VKASACTWLQKHKATLSSSLLSNNYIILEPSSEELWFPSVWVLHRVCKFALSMELYFTNESEARPACVFPQRGSRATGKYNCFYWECHRFLTLSMLQLRAQYFKQGGSRATGRYDCFHWGCHRFSFSFDAANKCTVLYTEREQSYRQIRLLSLSTFFLSMPTNGPTNLFSLLQLYLPDLLRSGTLHLHGKDSFQMNHFNRLNDSFQINHLLL